MIECHHIVFLCVANSARSQMAEGLARASAPAGWTASSAGSDPGSLHPHAIQVMAEIGIDISHHVSKGLDQVPIERAEMIVTLCAEEACPTTPPHVARLSWPIPDPAGPQQNSDTPIDAFRTARDVLRQRVNDLWADLASTPGA